MHNLSEGGITVKKYLFTILASAVTFAHIFMLSTIQNGSITGYLPMLISISAVVSAIYLITALPLSLLLNKRNKRFNFIDLVIYLIGALLVMQAFNGTFILMLNMNWEMFTEDWIIYAEWLGVGVGYWFWNSIFVINNKKVPV